MALNIIQARADKCPKCGIRLVLVRDLLRCEEHGEFFIYGSQLLVHVPSQRVKLPNNQLPWER